MTTEPPPFTLDHQKSEVPLPDWTARLGLGAIAWIRLLLIALVGALGDVPIIVEIDRTALLASSP